MTNKELAEKQEQEIKQYELKFVEERQKLKADAAMLQCQLDRALEKNKIDDRKNMGIITDYKQIIQRQEDQITKLNTMLEDMTVRFCAIRERERERKRVRNEIIIFLYSEQFRNV